MSNIFDALRKKEGEVGRPAQVEPKGKSALSGKKRVDPRTERELEALRDRLAVHFPKSDRKVFCIGGAVTGEGASTVALHLARALSRGSDSKTLLIDADLSGSPHTLSRAAVGSTDGAGLADLLEGRVDLTAAILGTEDPHLHFLPAGGGTRAALDLLASDMMRQFLADMGQIYSFVLVDCPAVLENSESSLLGTLTQGMILVVRANNTRREVVQRALALLSGSNCTILGVVLNQRRYPIPEFLYKRL